MIQLEVLRYNPETDQEPRFQRYEVPFRDDWVGQAKVLAAGGETEHSRRVERGEST